MRSSTIHACGIAVCEKSVQLMQRLEKKISEMASSTEVQDAVEKTLTEKLKGKDAAAVAEAGLPDVDLLPPRSSLEAVVVGVRQRRRGHACQCRVARESRARHLRVNAPNGR